MQNAQIWKSIEALCDEAESVIKDCTPVVKIIKSIAPPKLAYQQTSSPAAVKVLSGKPPPPIASVIDRSTPHKELADAHLSPATLTEIAAAIDRASQSAQKPQIMDQPSQAVNDQLRKDLMIEVSLAVRSVLASELPKIIHHAISESLYELINSSAKPVANNLEAPKDKKKKVITKKKAVPKKRSKNS